MCLGLWPHGAHGGDGADKSANPPMPVAHVAKCCVAAVAAKAKICHGQGCGCCEIGKVLPPQMTPQQPQQGVWGCGCGMPPQQCPQKPMATWAVCGLPPCSKHTHRQGPTGATQDGWCVAAPRAACTTQWPSIWLFELRHCPKAMLADLSALPACLAPPAGSPLGCLVWTVITLP